MEQAVTFHSQGQLIVANLGLPYAGAPCIIMSHGLESSKDGDKWLSLAPRLYAAGFAYLRFSYRGCGQGEGCSQGSFENTTLSGRVQDYRAAIDFVETAAVAKKGLGVVASSFGGTVAIAAGDIRIKAMVTMATPCRFEAPTEEQLKMYQTRGFFDLPSGRRLRTGFWYDVKRLDVCNAVARINCPLLIIHGSADKTVPVADVHQLYEKANTIKRLEIIEGGNHGFDNPAHLEQVIGLTLDWFKKYL